MTAPLLDRADLFGWVKAVTPATVRRRRRRQQLRGPVVRPQHRAPQARPQQPTAPGAGQPVALHLWAPRSARPVGATRRVARPAVEAGVRLTDRGIAVIVGLLAVLVLSTVVVGCVKFFGVSNAPLDDQGARGAEAVAVANS